MHLVVKILLPRVPPHDAVVTRTLPRIARDSSLGRVGLLDELLAEEGQSVVLQMDGLDFHRPFHEHVPGDLGELVVVQVQDAEVVPVGKRPRADLCDFVVAQDDQGERHEFREYVALEGVDRVARQVEFLEGGGVLEPSRGEFVEAVAGEVEGVDFGAERPGFDGFYDVVVEEDFLDWHGADGAVGEVGDVVPCKRMTIGNVF